MSSDRDEFQQRLRASALSLWELGDLLGIHPHLLPDYGPGSLGHLPARLVVNVAHLLDMHPADLVPGLDTVLHNPRLDTDTDRAGPDAPDTDALTLLTALATATAPLTTDQLAQALTWTLERTITALEQATTKPAVAGPLALRRVAPNTYTVTARLDVLTSDQRRALHDIARWTQPLTVEQANVLLAALVLHSNEYADLPGPSYAEWREDHLDAERALRVSGLLYADHNPHAAEINPEVLYSLRCRDTPRPDGQLPVHVADT